MKIHRSNLLSYLYLAEHQRSQEETKVGYTFESGYLRALRDTIEALEKGQELEFYKDTD